MTDFDEVLERLVTDPGFAAALRADPAAALHGYRLDDDERALLHRRVQLGDEGGRAVEDRVSKSGLVGLVGPVVSGLGFVAPEQAAPQFGVAPPAGVPELGVVQGVPELSSTTGVAELGVSPGAGEATLGGASVTLEAGVADLPAPDERP